MGTLDEDLRAVKAVEDKIITNKVANFAYTDKAYTDNDADSVAEYNVENEQNIPNAETTTLKVNETVLLKGFRAKASSLTRMLVNHFFGRVSYNLNKVNDSVSNLVNTLISHRGAANGLATLDDEGRIPYSQLLGRAVKSINNISPDSTGNVTIPVASETKKGIVKQDVLIGFSKVASLTTNYLRGITYDNGLFVAVGYNEEIQTSSDGITWTKRTPGATNSFYGVAYGNGLFVAVGLGQLITTSPDGITWTKRVSGATDGLSGITYGNGLFVAVGNNGGITTSPDGITWTKRVSGATDVLSGITYGNGLFVAVGYNEEIVTSPDGITWTKRTPGATNSLRGITYGNGLFVAVGYNGEIQTSSDGITWTKRTPGATDDLNGITYGNGLFVAVGNNGGITTSPDGITWTKRVSGVANGLSGITYGNGLFVAVGGTGTILNGNFTNAVAIDAEGNMTVPVINSILERLKALEAK